MAEKRDYYEVLGIGRDATSADIKRAYRNLAKKLHPDHNDAPDAEDRFNEVREAYDILSNEQKRKAYDQFGHAGTEGFAGGGTGFSGFTGSTPFDMGDLGDILNSFFGGMGGFGFDMGGMGRSAVRRRVRGEDIRVSVQLSFDEAIWGKEETVTVNRRVVCSKCSGTGAEGGNLKVCSQCGGRGRVRRVQNTLLGGISMVTVCPGCEGAGQVPEKKCAECGGSGVQTERKRLKIKIPEGSYDGMVLRFRHGGHAGENGGEPGDLYVELQVEVSPVYERSGDDMYVDVQISAPTAVLGGTVNVPTVHGDMTLKIQKGTQPNSIFRLSKKGAPKLGGRGFGDEYVRVKVDIPRKLSREQMKIWEELRDV